MCPPWRAQGDDLRTFLGELVSSLAVCLSQEVEDLSVLD
jgi:hypothetical protein